MRWSLLMLATLVLPGCKQPAAPTAENASERASTATNVDAGSAPAVDARAASMDAAVALVDASTAGMAKKDDFDPKWCLTPDGFPDDGLVKPFTMSGIGAVAAAMRSKHFRKLKAKVPGAAIDERNFACARPCAAFSRECGFEFRASDLAKNPDSNLLEWMAVDPFAKLLWFQDDAGVWRSEPIR